MTYIHRSESHPIATNCLRVFVSCWEYRVSASAVTERKNIYSKQKYFSKEATSAETLAQSRQCMDAHQEIKDNSAGLLTSPQLTFYLLIVWAQLLFSTMDIATHKETWQVRNNKT
jgi:hypothetical protein